MEGGWCFRGRRKSPRRGCLCNAAEGGRWNFFPDAAGVCLTPRSMCSGCFGSGSCSMQQRLLQGSRNGLFSPGEKRNALASLRPTAPVWNKRSGTGCAAVLLTHASPFLRSAPPAPRPLAHLALWKNLVKCKKFPNPAKSHQFQALEKGGGGGEETGATREAGLGAERTGVCPTSSGDAAALEPGKSNRSAEG